MSVDVYLYGPPQDEPCCECGHVRPVAKPLFEANITHNLIQMADASDLYRVVWRPEEVPYHLARELIEPLQKGIETLRSEPARFRVFDAPNGWGTYEEFVPWLERYRKACEQFPDAEVKVFR